MCDEEAQGGRKKRKGKKKEIKGRKKEKEREGGMEGGGKKRRKFQGLHSACLGSTESVNDLVCCAATRLYYPHGK